MQLVAFLMLLLGAMGLRFEIPAEASDPQPQCVREFVTDGQLVVVSVNTNGHANDGQILSLRIVSADGDEYRRKDDINGSFKVAFNAHETSSFDVCFTNKIQPGWRNSQQMYTDVDLEVEAGANARDWNAIQSAEKLKPAEVQLRKVDEMLDDISHELQYLIEREKRLRNTNESTGNRVKNFFILSIFLLIGVGAYQIVYLRNYFRSKHIL